MNKTKHVSTKQDHICSMYCDGEVHASLMYGYHDIPIEMIKSQFQDTGVYNKKDSHCRGIIVDIKRAPEADGLADGNIWDRPYAYLVFVDEGVKSEV